MAGPKGLTPPLGQGMIATRADMSSLDSYTPILSDIDTEEPRNASWWSRLALVVYWLAIILAIAWAIATRSPSLREATFLILLGILAGALPMEKRAGRLRLGAVSWQVTHDPLTRLHNRAYFMSQLAKQLKKRRRHGSSIAVLLLDLDRFKTVNDTLGHASGDKLLQEVGQRLSSMFSNVVVARLGGDEFGILVEVGSHDELTKFAQRVVDTLDFRTTVNSQPLWVNTSVGAAIASIPRPTLVELLSMADIALYQAKTEGRNRLSVFEPHKPIPTVSQLSMDYEIRLAVERKQLRLLYQPIVNLKTGRIDGFEALVRWTHPTFGGVSPSIFIPMAEENGWIQEIGRWILHEACQQAAEWHVIFGSHLTMSINLSALQFSRTDVTSEVEQILNSTGVVPEAIHLEITETALGQDESTTLHNIAELRRIGVSLAVDDFGVGYSSLNYLRKYPADFLKIDKSFVDEIENTRTWGVVRAAVDVGHILGMKIVAEGVETPEQLTLVARLGTDYAQGFLFHKPMDARAIANVLLEEMDRFSDLRNSAVA